MRAQPYWRDVPALCSQARSKEYLDYLGEGHVEYIVAGGDHVDMRAALEELNTRYGVESIRVDSGGTLNGVRLPEGLVDEVSLLINPALVGGDISALDFSSAAPHFVRRRDLAWADARRAGAR